MEHTSNYNLSQWAGEDRILREDFNADNAKIEAALLQHASTLATAGNCKIVAGSYEGTGTYGSANPSSLDFAATLGTAPRFIYIASIVSNYSMAAVRNQTTAYTNTASDSSCNITWTATGLSWYSSKGLAYQLNASGKTYYYVALA